MNLTSHTNSRLIRKLNRRQTRVIGTVFFAVIVLTLCLYLPWAYRISLGNIDNTASILADEYTELIEGFQAQIFTFTHDSDTWQAINDYSGANGPERGPHRHSGADHQGDRRGDPQFLSG